MLRDLQAAIHGGLVLPGDEDSTSLKSLRSILQSTLTALSGGWFRRCDQVQCAIQNSRTTPHTRIRQIVHNCDVHHLRVANPLQIRLISLFLRQVD
jgi:hypothetical protein